MKNLLFIVLLFASQSIFAQCTNCEFDLNNNNCLLEYTKNGKVVNMINLEDATYVDINSNTIQILNGSALSSSQYIMYDRNRVSMSYNGVQFIPADMQEVRDSLDSWINDCGCCFGEVPVDIATSDLPYSIVNGSGLCDTLVGCSSISFAWGTDGVGEMRIINPDDGHRETIITPDDPTPSNGWEFRTLDTLIFDATLAAGIWVNVQDCYLENTRGQECQFLTYDSVGWYNNFQALNILNNRFDELTNDVNSIVVGCATFDATFNTGADVIAYFPDGGGNVALGASLVDPLSPQSSLLEQVLVLQLNLRLNQYVAEYRTPTALKQLGDMLYVPFDPYFGLTVNQIMTDAKNTLGTCSGAPSAALLTALININSAFSNGGDGAGILSCPIGS